MRGRAAGLDYRSRASASCYASSGCGGPLFRHGCCGVVRCPGLDERLVTLATGLVFAPHSPRLSRCFLRLRCTSTGGSLACCGGLASASPFLCFLGRLLLRDRRSVVSVFVSLSLAFVAAHGVEADGVFLYHNCGLCLIIAAKPPYGVDGAVFRGAVVCVLHGVPLKGAEVVTAVSRPGGTS